MDNLIGEAAERLFTDQCPPHAVREIDEGGSAEALWRTLEESGFLDAMVPEQSGGSGLGLKDGGGLVSLTGQYALPVPFAETMIARGLLASKGVQPPHGAIAIADPLERQPGHLYCPVAVAAVHAQWILGSYGGETRLLASAKLGARSPLSPLDVSVRWPLRQWTQAPSIGCDTDLGAVHALVRALQLCGAMRAVLERSLAYANERHQFGRPIGKFQAIQHELAIMAEHVYAACMSAELAAWQRDLRFDLLKIAVAKARASEAAAEVAALAHSVHGAIGFSQEYPLQLWTRRLHTWRQVAGSESYWHDVLGEALLDHTMGPSLDLLRAVTDRAA